MAVHAVDVVVIVCPYFSYCTSCHEQTVPVFCAGMAMMLGSLRSMLFKLLSV